MNSAQSPAPVEISNEHEQLLSALIRGIFPHDSFPDGPYERTAKAVIDSVSENQWAALILQQGLLSLAMIAPDFGSLEEDDQVRILRSISTTEFFDYVRATAVVELYDDEDTWNLLGYEGPSFDEGGYLHRGFNDLDWLPEPRVEEYDGPDRLVEVAGLGAPAIDDAPASHPGRATATLASDIPNDEKGA